MPIKKRLGVVNCTRHKFEVTVGCIACTAITRDEVAFDLAEDLVEVPDIGTMSPLRNL